MSRKSFIGSCSGKTKDLSGIINMLENVMSPPFKNIRMGVGALWVTMKGILPEIVLEMEKCSENDNIYGRVNLEICLGEELFSSDVVLYVLDVESDSDTKLVFIMNEELCPTTSPISELDNIILGDMVRKKTIFSPEDIKEIKKKQ